MKKINEKITEVIKKSSIFLLMEIVAILLITTTLFIFKITITKWHLPIITCIAAIVFLLFYKKENIKTNLISLIVGMIIFTGVTYVEGKIYDATADGNTYHKLAIGCMKNGWNPNYEDSKDRNKENGNCFDVSEDNINTLWIDHYAKGTEIFASVVYAFTGNIESGKGYTLLLMYSAFGIIFSYLYKNKKRNLFTSIIIPFLLSFNAITLVQIFNFYVDGTLMISILLIIFSCLVEKDKDNTNTKENLFILFSNILICINAKFTGIAFAALYCLGFYIYWIVKAFMESKEKGIKELKKYTIFYTITVIISVLIVGYSSYTRNLIDHGNPLYPLYGKGHVDNMVVQEQPSSFKDKNHAEIFLISMFSKGVNVSPSYSDENVQPTLKIPGTISMDEIKNYSIPDIRISGFGPLFSCIFIISIITTIIIIAKLIKEKKYDKLIQYSIILGITAILILALDGNYWARYIPYFYAIPLISMSYLLWDKEKKIKFGIGILMSAIMLVNSILVCGTVLYSTKSNNAYIKRNINDSIQYFKENKNVDIKLNHIGLQGVLYNLDDLKIKNYTINQNIKAERDGYFYRY